MGFGSSNSVTGNSAVSASSSAGFSFTGLAGEGGAASGKGGGKGGGTGGVSDDGGGLGKGGRLSGGLPEPLSDALAACSSEIEECLRVADHSGSTSQAPVGAKSITKLEGLFKEQLVPQVRLPGRHPEFRRILDGVPADGDALNEPRAASKSWKGAASRDGPQSRDARAVKQHRR